MTQRLNDLAVSDLVARLATSDPVPGGGSASALAGAMAAALVEMVVALTVGRPAAEGHEAELGRIGSAATDLRTELLRLAEVDADAYAAVVAARRMPKDTDAERAERAERVRAAVRDATRAPLEVVLRSVEALTLAESLAPIGNRNAASDVGVAGLLAAAAIRGAAMNVEINLPALAQDDDLREEARVAMDAHLADLDARAHALASAVGERIG
ncbi:MAG: cyclodeaminase/cyclohydrolase family protein [Chloroflexota bacterium]|nr:cyclodeaminase/cyclohydrolase family protein [Chloroflexota bacterium]